MDSLAHVFDPGKPRSRGFAKSRVDLVKIETALDDLIRRDEFPLDRPHLTKMLGEARRLQRAYAEDARAGHHTGDGPEIDDLVLDPTPEPAPDYWPTQVRPSPYLGGLDLSGYRGGDGASIAPLDPRD